MNCNNCGHVVSQDSKFCNNCGNEIIKGDREKPSQDEQTEEIKNLDGSDEEKSHSPFIKSKLGFIAIGIVIVLVISLSFVLGSKNEFKRAVESGQLEEALKIYKEFEDERDTEEASNYLTITIEKIEEDFIEEKVYYEEAIENLDNINKLHIVDSLINSARENIKRLNNSRIAYNKLVDYFNNGVYKSVIDESNNVLEEDENYDSAIEYKNKSMDEVEKETISKAKQLAEEENFKAAVKELNDSKKYVKDYSSLEKMIYEYNEEVSKEAILSAMELSEAGDFKEAITLLENNKNHSFEKNIESEIEKIIELRREKNTENLREIKPRLIINYDDVEKEYKIGPKGYSTRYVNFSNTINIEPRMTFNKAPSFLLGVGFHQRDWIFFENVIFSIDGKNHNWDLNYFDRDSQVGNGVSEWYFVVHSGLLSGYTSQVKDLTALMDSLINSNSAKIRFSGQGYRDHTITSKEKQTLRDLWMVNNILEEDPDLFDIIRN